MKRRAASVIFALEVALAPPTTAQAAARSTLLKIAYNEAEKVLRADRTDVNTDDFVDHLARIVIECFARGAPADDRRQTWAADASLPAYVRALALWTNPSLLLADAARSLEVACAITDLVTSSEIRMRAWRQAAALADLGVAVASQAGLLARVTPTLASFRQRMVTDLELPNDGWRTLDQTLVGALAGPGAERDTLVAMPGWENSACVRLIRGL